MRRGAAPSGYSTHAWASRPSCTETPMSTDASTPQPMQSHHSSRLSLRQLRSGLAKFVTRRVTRTRWRAVSELRPRGKCGLKNVASFAQRGTNTGGEFRCRPNSINARSAALCAAHRTCLDCTRKRAADPTCSCYYVGDVTSPLTRHPACGRDRVPNPQGVDGSHIATLAARRRPSRSPDRIHDRRLGPAGVIALSLRTCRSSLCPTYPGSRWSSS